MIAITLISCNSGTTEKASTGLKRFDIDFVNAQIDLPAEYIFINTDDFIQILSSVEEVDSILIEDIIVALKELKKSSAPYLLLADSNDIRNNILIHLGEHIQISREMAAGYVGLMEDMLDSKWDSMHIQHAQLESRLFSGKSSQMIKLKYFLLRNEESAFMTQYILATSKKSIGFIVSSKSEEDFEQNIRNIIP